MTHTLFQAAQREARFRARTQGSFARYQRAVQSLAGGVSTSLRRSARPYPLYFARGGGAEAVDVDGNRYIDYGLAWGPLILGHCHPAVVEAASRALAAGATYGAQHDLEFEVAEMIQRAVPCAGLVCFANSGTEIVQVALRLARAVTGRSLHLKFEGHYHGWDDSVLVSYRSSIPQLEAATPQPVPTGLGQRSRSGAVVARWNHRESVEAAFSLHDGEIAAIICEPLLCNSGCIPPEPGFLEFLRETATRHGALLIFDEVITGFRLSLGGAQQHYGVTPDLATFAKAVGGGLPLSVLAGRREFMDWIADGRVVHAGTLNGNPVALGAARATLGVLAENDGAVYSGMWARGEALRHGIAAALRRAGLPVQTSGGGPVFQVSFQPSPAREYRDTLAADKAIYSDFAMALLDEGVMVLPDGRWYVSAAHTDSDVERTLAAVRAAAG
ncbi:MAG: glutamate-1-semialdehyde 2,1-aminomutase [Bryobacterales bacterium]|nr:glutamate-1-semialdehyde 2,1-aminomutase [Bryobacterales bacterium]